METELIERTTLVRRSDELAASFLQPLSDGQPTRQVAAMDEASRLPAASMVRVAPTDPAQPEAEHCRRAYGAELGRRIKAGSTPRRASRPMPTN